jgi:hypothetical protein
MARDRGVPWPGPLRSWRAGVNTRLGRPSRRRQSGDGGWDHRPGRLAGGRLG